MVKHILKLFDHLVAPSF